MITRHRFRAEVLDRQAGLRSGVPAVVLLVGLAIVAFIVVLGNGPSPSELRLSTRADFGLYTVAYPGSGGNSPYFDQAALDPFADGRLRIMMVLLTVMYFASTAAIGSIIVRGIRRSDRWPRSVVGLAGFLPGYLMLLAPLQLLFAAVPVLTASWIALLGAPAIAVMLHRRAIARRAELFVHDRAALGRWIVAAGGVSVVVTLALVHRLQAGRFFMTQDSIQWFLIAAADQMQGQWGAYLAQWAQQSDEWVFSAPLMFWSPTSSDFWFSIYAAQCLSLVSVSATVFGVVYGLARRRKVLAAAVATAAVFGSTLAIYPWIYITIIGGDNPVFTTGQVGRHIGIVAPWVALLMVGRQPRSVIAAGGLVTLGLGFTSMEVLPSVLAALLAGIAWRSLRERRGPRVGRRGLRVGLHLAAVCALAAISCAFWVLHRLSSSSDAVWWLFAGSAVALIGAVVLCVRTPDRRLLANPRSLLIWLPLWIGAAGVGMVLANNMTRGLLDGWFQTQLASVFPGYGGVTLGRPDLPVDLFDGLSLRFSTQACNFWSYCHAFTNFLDTFGFLFVVALATWLSFGPLTSEPEVNARRAVWLLMVSGLGLGLAIVIFNNSPGYLPSSLLSRFLEAPYYGLLALAALSFAESRSRVSAVAGTGVLILWTVIPLIATQWPEQMVRNAGWLLQRFGVL